MKVQITKDEWGICVWPIDEKLEYSGNKGNIWKQEGDFTPAWIRKGITFFQSSHQIFTEKQVKKYMPDLGNDMKNGDLKICDLTIV